MHNFKRGRVAHFNGKKYIYFSKKNFEGSFTIDIFHGLSYGEISSGLAWLVGENKCSSEKDFSQKFKMISRTGFVFLVAFTVHELWPVSIFIMMSGQKNTVFMLGYRCYSKGQTFVSFIGYINVRIPTLELREQNLVQSLTRLCNTFLKWPKPKMQNFGQK